MPTEETTARYGIPAYGPALVTLVALTAASGVAMVARCGATEPWWAAAVWLSVVAGGGWVLLARAAHRLELTPTELRWRTPLRHGAIPARDVTVVRRFRGAAGGFAVIESTSHRPLLVLVHRGLVDLATDIRRDAAPDLRIELGVHARVCERFNIVSWYRG